MTWNPSFAFGCVPVQRLGGRARLGGGGGARARGGAADQVAPAATTSVLMGRLAVVLVVLRLPGILWRYALMQIYGCSFNIYSNMKSIM